MARSTFEFLSKEEIVRIHEVSLRVLDEVGVVVHSKPVANMLVDSGSRRSKDGKRVLIDEQAVKKALASVPKSVLLAARNKEQDVRVPSGKGLQISNGGEGVQIKDLVTGESRRSTLEDLKAFTYLVDRLPQADFAWAMVGALDQPGELKGTIELKAVFESTTKHFQGGANDAEEARSMIDLSCIITGGPEQLRKRPIFSSVQCPISPLAFEVGLVEAQVEFAKAGIPIVAMVASVAGLTSPVTLAGSLAQINAENLASLVISQTASKGAPWIFSSDSVPGDLTTGSIDYGSMEALLMRTGAGQMGKSYGLPTMVAGIGIESASLQLGSVRDGVSHSVLQGLVPSDLGSGLGGYDQAASASFEQLLVDAWIWEVAREFVRDFSADENAISFETIRDAGIDGNFLGKRHTLTRFKKEFASTMKKDAVLTSNGGSAPKGALLKKAKEEAQRMLREPRKLAVSKDEASRMESFIDGLARRR